MIHVVVDYSRVRVREMSSASTREYAIAQSQTSRNTVNNTTNHGKKNFFYTNNIREITSALIYITASSSGGSYKTL